MRKFNFRRREVPRLNTTSTADISFMLLVFFLMTTSLNKEKGVGRLLPPPADTTQVNRLEVKKEELMWLTIDEDNRMRCDGEAMGLDEMKKKVKQFIAGKPQTHVVSIASDPQADYEHYFLVQHAVIQAYRELRDDYASRTFGKPLAKCSAEQRAEVVKKWPQRIADSVEDMSADTEKGGEK